MEYRFALLLVFALSCDARAEQGLANCAEQFPAGSTENAPATIATKSSTSNIAVCRRSGDVSFFALEYDPNRYAPIWVAYRIANTFGEGGCASMTRESMQCHSQREDVQKCIDAPKHPADDPFHRDPLLAQLKVPHLGVLAFAGTGHDRGHMAPNNAFSWHACGAYKTFTMANMAAQWGSLNRALWANLEAQVLYWGVNQGPIYVTTGPIWKRFPSDRFEAINKGFVNQEQFTPPSERLAKLKKKGAKKPPPPLPQKIPVPTGFYTVVFQQGTDSQPSRAIAFLAPHTKQAHEESESKKGKKTKKALSFWYFVSTVSLVEESSGLRFGFADELKGWPDLGYWQGLGQKKPGGWSVRGKQCDKPAPVGWMPERPLTERVAICQSSDAVK